MENKKLGQEPAYPVNTKEVTRLPYERETTVIDVINPGMSKRFYAACAAMQGMISNVNTTDSIKSLVQVAYEYADELLRQEGL